MDVTNKYFYVHTLPVTWETSGYFVVYLEKTFRSMKDKCDIILIL